MKLVPMDYILAAEKLHCDVPAIIAVSEVEARGSGFLRNGKPRILFESAKFSKFTKGEFDESHPDLSTPTWVRNYKGGAREYGRLDRAIGLNEDAALLATSWGMFQVMGFNHKLVGFPQLFDFVDAMYDSEADHLNAFLAYVLARRLDDEIRDLRWAAFARGYNGSGYRKNKYDIKLAKAYKKYSRLSPAPPRPNVRDIQAALNRHGAELDVDGKTGPATRLAISDFQLENGLSADGIAGPITLRELGFDYGT